MLMNSKLVRRANLRSPSAGASCEQTFAIPQPGSWGPVHPDYHYLRKSIPIAEGPEN